MKENDIWCKAVNGVDEGAGQFSHLPALFNRRILKRTESFPFVIRVTLSADLRLWVMPSDYLCLGRYPSGGGIECLVIIFFVLVIGLPGLVTSRSTGRERRDKKGCYVVLSTFSRKWLREGWLLKECEY